MLLWPDSEHNILLMMAHRSVEFVVFFNRWKWEPNPAGKEMLLETDTVSLSLTWASKVAKARPALIRSKKSLYYSFYASSCCNLWCLLFFLISYVSADFVQVNINITTIVCRSQNNIQLKVQQGRWWSLQFDFCLSWTPVLSGDLLELSLKSVLSSVFLLSPHPENCQCGIRPVSVEGSCLHLPQFSSFPSFM